MTETTPPPLPAAPDPQTVPPDPLPEHRGERRAVPAGLFGAAVPDGAFRYNPTPVVTVNGQDLRPALVTGAGPVVVDGVTITWGRADILDQPDPATGRLQLFDATGTWAHDQRRPGQTVSLRWEGTDPITGAHTSVVYFRGRIGDPIKVAPKTVRDPVTGDPVHGALVDLPLVSVLVDLANLVQRVDWPAETLFDRAGRIQNIAKAAGAVDLVLVRPYWRDPQVAPVAATEQVPILEHLTRLFDSCGGDRLTYIPATKSVEYIARKHWGAGVRGTAQLNWAVPGANIARAGQGVFAMPYLYSRPDGAQQPSLVAAVDGRLLEYEPADGAQQPARITRVSVTNPDQADAYQPRTTEVMVPGAGYELVNGTRSAHLDSIIAWNSWADVSATDVASMMAYEGSAWRLEPVHLSTRKAGGFESSTQARILLAGAETDSLIFLSPTWLPRLGLRPVFGIQGATIGYSHGGWDLSVDLAPMGTETPQHAITWEEVDDGSTTFEVQWWDGDNPHGVHESLTYEDCGHIATGVGVSIANTGQNFGFDA